MAASWSTEAMSSFQFRALLLIAVVLGGLVNAIVSSATPGTLPVELALA